MFIFPVTDEKQFDNKGMVWILNRPVKKVYLLNTELGEELGHHIWDFHVNAKE